MNVRLVALSETAKLLGVSIPTIRRFIARGELVTVNIGTRRMISSLEVDRILRFGVGQARPTKAHIKAG